MNIYHKSARWAFFITLLFSLIGPVLFPSLKLAYFAPFLIIIYYQKNFTYCLAASLLCGFLGDLFVSKTPLGFFALSYMLTTSLLFEQKRHFFGDSKLCLPLMVFLFSSISYTIQIALFYIFTKAFEESLMKLFFDIIYFGICNATYAFFTFNLFWLISGTIFRKRHS